MTLGGKDANYILDRENVAIPTYSLTFVTYSLSCASLLVLIIQISMLASESCLHLGQKSVFSLVMVFNTKGSIDLLYVLVAVWISYMF